MNNTLFLASALMLGAIVSPVGAQEAPAMVSESVTAQDRANVQIVEAFLAAWSSADRGASYLAPDASTRLDEEKPARMGMEGFREFWKVLEPGQNVSVKIDEIYARNPLVVVTHTDTIKTPGKADIMLHLVGTFMVRDGKIVEVTDFYKK